MYSINVRMQIVYGVKSHTTHFPPQVQLCAIELTIVARADALHVRKCIASLQNCAQMCHRWNVRASAHLCLGRML